MLHILLSFSLSLSLSSRCRLFHNAIFFGSCNIHILNRGCAKIKKKIDAKGLIPPYIKNKTPWFLVDEFPLYICYYNRNETSGYNAQHSL